MIHRKGILLAGGNGTRLLPLTKVVSKQLLPVYDKPMIYYPLWSLRVSGCDEILVITRPQDRYLYEALLGNGAEFGCQLSYAEQQNPSGIAEALILGEEFLDGDEVVLALGDNVLHGLNLDKRLGELSHTTPNAILAYSVTDPRAYGVVEVDDLGFAVNIEEKPEQPKSYLAVPGLYFYDCNAPRIAASLQPSARGELEITDVSRAYIDEGLRVLQLNRLAGDLWFDCGTPELLATATTEIGDIVQRTGGFSPCDPRRCPRKLGSY